MPNNHAFILGAGIAQLVERPTRKPGAIVTCYLPTAGKTETIYDACIPPWLKSPTPLHRRTHARRHTHIHTRACTWYSQIRERLEVWVIWSFLFFRGEVACFCLSSSVFSCCRLYVCFVFWGAGALGMLLYQRFCCMNAIQICWACTQYPWHMLCWTNIVKLIYCVPFYAYWYFLSFQENRERQSPHRCPFTVSTLPHCSG